MDTQLAEDMLRFCLTLYEEYKDVDHHHKHSLHPDDLARLKHICDKWEKEAKR